jgi:3-oxoacyl-[acyl-carrier protein] reductase
MLKLMNDLQGKVALVTGSSRGIGRAIAIALAGAGADVIVNFRERGAEAQAVEKHIRSLQRRCVTIQADVSAASEVNRLMERSETQLGPVDILVNNAGVARTKPIEQLTEEDWDEIIDTNLKSCFLVTQAALPGMRARQWGRIINLSSVAAQTGGVIGPHYAASKAGMLGLTHFYAQRLAKEGITVNAIAPALIKTEMITSNPNARADLIPVGRFGSDDEVSDIAVMLAQNAYITGQTINVNGGWFMN